MAVLTIKVCTFVACVLLISIYIASVRATGCDSEQVEKCRVAGLECCDVADGRTACGEVGLGCPLLEVRDLQDRVGRVKPTRKTTNWPSKSPRMATANPTRKPRTARPTRKRPTFKPTRAPTAWPSKAPTQPTNVPTKRPTRRKPTKRPSSRKPTTKFPTRRHTTRIPSSSPAPTEIASTGQPTLATTFSPSNSKTSSPVGSSPPTGSSSTFSPAIQGEFSLRATLKPSELQNKPDSAWFTCGALCLSSDASELMTVYSIDGGYGAVIFKLSLQHTMMGEQTPIMSINFPGASTTCAFSADGSYGIVSGTPEITQFVRNGNVWSKPGPALSSSIMLGTDLSMSLDGNTIVAAACASRGECDFSPPAWSIVTFDRTSRAASWLPGRNQDVSSTTSAVISAETLLSGDGLTLGIYSDDYYDPLYVEVFSRPAINKAWARIGRIQFGSALQFGLIAADFSADGLTAVVVNLVAPDPSIDGPSRVTVQILTRTATKFFSLKQTLKSRVIVEVPFVRASMNANGTSITVSYENGIIRVFDLVLATWVEQTPIILPNGTTPYPPFACSWQSYQVKMSGDGKTIAVGPLDGCGVIGSSIGGSLRGSTLIYSRT